MGSELAQLSWLLLVLVVLAVIWYGPRSNGARLRGAYRSIPDQMRIPLIATIVVALLLVLYGTALSLVEGESTSMSATGNALLATATLILVSYCSRQP